MNTEQEAEFTPQGAAETVEKSDKNLIRDFFGIIFDPVKTFSKVLGIEYWVGIFLITLIIGGGLEQIYHTQVIDLTTQKMLEKAGDNASKLQGMMDFYNNPAMSRPAYFFGTIFGQVVFLLIGTVLYFFACSVVFGGTAKFKQVWIVACWSSIIILIQMIIKTPLILAKNSVEAGLNLGLIFNADMVGTKLHSFFNVIDIFGIWHFIVVGIGLAILYKFTIKKGIGISFAVWLLMVMVGGVSAYLSA
jgi:hypothetical protein